MSFLFSKLQLLESVWGGSEKTIPCISNFTATFLIKVSKLYSMISNEHIFKKKKTEHTQLRDIPSLPFYIFRLTFDYITASFSVQSLFSPSPLLSWLQYSLRASIPVHCDPNSSSANQMFMSKDSIRPSCVPLQIESGPECPALD